MTEKVSTVETTEPMTVESAAESLLLTTETQEEAATEETANAEDVDTEAEEATLDDEDADEEEVEAEDAEVSDDDGEEDDEGEEDDSEQEPPESYTVTVDGKEEAVTLDELKRSYSGQKYIQKGMQEAAEARKQAEAIQADLQQKSAFVEQFVQQLQQGGVQAPPTPPDPQLINSDPIGYMEAKANYDQEVQAYQDQQQKLSYFQQEKQQMMQQQRQEFVKQQAELLKQEIPEFADPQKAEAVKGRLVQAGQEYGLSQEELGQIIDARYVKILNDAAKYRELQKSKKTVSEKAKKARPMVKGGAKKRVDPKAAQREKIKARLKKTGSLEDAASLLLE